MEYELRILGFRRRGWTQNDNSRGSSAFKESNDLKSMYAKGNKRRLVGLGGLLAVRVPKEQGGKN